MISRLSASEQELQALARVVSEVRPDLPAQGSPLSLLSDLKDQIPCDVLLCHAYDSTLRQYWFTQQIPGEEGNDEAADRTLAANGSDLCRVMWEHYWDCQVFSYPDRSGDLRSIVKVDDFYSARQLQSTGMYRDVMRPQGLEKRIQLCLSEPPGPGTGPGRSVRLLFLRGPGLDFSERDRALLTLLRPHLQQAYHDAERRRSPVPKLTARQWDLLHLIAAGRTNTQIARQLGLSEGTVRTHLENIYARLNVSNRTAAVVRAFPDRVA
jgi:DNA-binding CsgD family transcriptional regulator